MSLSLSHAQTTNVEPRFKYDFANSVREREKERMEPAFAPVPAPIIIKPTSIPSLPSHLFHLTSPSLRPISTPPHPDQRWIRVKKGSKFDSDKYTPEMWEKGGATTVTPKSGSTYTVWPVIHAELTKRKLQSLDAEAALKLQQAGKAVIVDCRPEYQFRKERIEGAISAPLFREVKGKGAWDNIKRAVMAVGLAMTATERNPDFLEDAKAALAAAGVRRGTKLILYCGLGGTIEVGVKPWAPDRTKEFKDDPERMFGRESRSLKACHDLLVEGGYRNGEVLHLKGGLGQWRYDGFPVESD